MRAWLMVATAVCGALMVGTAMGQATAPASRPVEYVEFDPRGGLWVDSAAVGRVRERVAKDEGAARVFAALRGEAEGEVGRVASPIAAIRYEGHVSNHPDRVASVRHLRDVEAVYALHWAAVMSGEERFARAAGRIVLAWARVYVPTGNDVNEGKLRNLVIAAARGGPACGTWTDSERAEVDAWLEKLAAALRAVWREDAVGNRAANRLTTLVTIANARGDAELRRFVAERGAGLVSRTLYADGRSHDLELRDAMHYHRSAVSQLARLAVAIGGEEGRAMYFGTVAEGPSIAKSVAYMLPFVRGEKVHPEWVNSKVDLDRKRWEAGDPYYRPGKPWDPTSAAEALTYAACFEPEMAGLAQETRAKKGEGLTWDVLVVEAAGGK